MKSNQTTKFRKASICIASMMLTLPVLAQDNTDDELSDDILLLSPFEVEASSNVGYLATQTLAGTRIKTDLRDVGSAISVVTKEMLRDTGATDNATLLSYTTNTEVGGTSGNFAGYTGDSAALDETATLLRPQTNTRVRGLAEADNTRNFFLSEVPWDSYNTERVDMQRGPNSILFGLGSPAGIINSSTNTANFDSNGGNIEFRVDRWGSFRSSVDYNQIVLEDQLAVRFDALYDDTKYRQDPAFETDQRMYLSLRYAPLSLNTENINTTIKVNFEHGEIDANRPRTLTPTDQITPWFDYLDQAGYETVAAWASPDDANAGPAQPSNNDNYGGGANPDYQPWITGTYADSYGGIIVSYSDPTTQDSIAYAGQYYLVGGLDINGAIDGTIDGTPFTRDPAIATYSQYAQSAGLPGYSTGAYKNKTLSDPSIFDFYNNLLDGSSKWESQNWDAYNINFSQGFLNNRISYEVVYDHQEYSEARESFLNSYQQSIAVDIRTVDSSGTENPNFGKAYVANRMAGGNESTDIERDSFRFTATAELRGSDLFDEDSLTAKLIGRHIFTGLFSQDKSTQDYRQWKRLNVGGAWYDVVGNNNATANDTSAYTVVYLSDSLAGLDSASGINLQPLAGNIDPESGLVHYFNSTWNSTADPAAWWDANDNGEMDHDYDNDGNDLGLSTAERQAENPDNYIGWTTDEFPITSSTTDRGELYTSARLMKNEIESKAFVWQAYLLDGLVVPTFGYREDTSNYWIHDATNDENILRSNHTVDTSSPYYILPDTISQSSKGNSKSWSLVVHSPDFINKHLPFNSTVSLFYNESENFRPEPGRVDLRGDNLPDPLGDTTDYGFVISAFDGRVNFKVNWFETNVQNATMGSGLGSLSDAIYMIGAAESWGGYYARRYANGEANGWGTWAWSWADNGYGLYGDYDSTVAGQAAALESWFAQEVPQEFLDFWSIDFMDTATNINRSRDDTNWTTPAGLTATSDMTSEGVEYELFIQPTDNWSISINASHTEASRYNLGSSLEEWILYRDYVFNETPAGEVRLWWPGGTDALVRDSWNNTVMSNYNLFKLLEHSSNPEVRPWRVNLITNYYFSEGTLKGLSVGGGYRWQDKSIIGYGLTEDAVDGWVYDLSNPHKGPTVDAVDLWVGYEMPITEKINWRLQLNIRNLFGKKELLPISTTPSLTDPTVTEVAAWSIAEGMSWSITNTFTF